MLNYQRVVKGSFHHCPKILLDHPSSPSHQGCVLIHITLWLFNIAMENGPFIDGLPIKNDDFPWLC